VEALLCLRASLAQFVEASASPPFVYINNFHELVKTPESDFINLEREKWLNELCRYSDREAEAMQSRTKEEQRCSSGSHAAVLELPAKPR